MVIAHKADAELASLTAVNRSNPPVLVNQAGAKRDSVGAQTDQTSEVPVQGNGTTSLQVTGESPTVAPIIPFPSELPDRAAPIQRGAVPVRHGSLGLNPRPAPPPRGFFAASAPAVGFFTRRTVSIGLFATAPRASGFFHDRQPSRSPR